MKIILATNNQGKVKELSDMLSDFDIAPQSTFNVPDADETGLTFVENAILKARHAAAITNTAVIADDSGLCVEALNGEPGIHSARFAGEHGNSNKNIDKLLSELNGVENRRAYFYCALVFLRHANDPTPIICEGRWDGIIATERSGTDGFGYDPVFFVSEENMTAAEFGKERKNTISHRAKALAKLKILLTSSS